MKTSDDNGKKHVLYVIDFNCSGFFFTFKEVGFVDSVSGHCIFLEKLRKIP